ncbi:MAG: hypothetical protein IPH54_22425 [Rhodoferax sp.]|nr:hypothetical protein [Rhodoferax sp.]
MAPDRPRPGRAGVVAVGELAPGQGSQLIAAIGQLARVTEIDELAARITSLRQNTMHSLTRV